LTRNHTQEIDYTRGDNGKGVRFGGYLIETSAATEQDFQRICEEHLRLCYELSLLDRMKAAAKEWASVEDLQNKMQALSRKALKSSDFLYPCRFCRHLWRA